MYYIILRGDIFKSEEKDKLLKKITQIERDQKRWIASFQMPLPKIVISSYVLPKIGFLIIQPPKVNMPNFRPLMFDQFVFKIPDLSFPKIEMPEINYDRIEKITNDNSKYGWTLTGEMSLGDYLEDDMVGVSAREKDNYFYHYYSKSRWENFARMKEEILENIELKWKELIQECFYSFDNDNYKLVIPTLFTIIEGEMSFVFQSHQGSYNLINLMGERRKKRNLNWEKSPCILSYIA